MEIQSRLVNELGDVVPSKSMVFNWALEFHQDRKSLEGDVFLGV